MGTAKLRIQTVTHRVCQCGCTYTQSDFEAIPRRVINVDGGLYEVRSCVSCGTDMARVIRLRVVDEVD